MWGIKKNLRMGGNAENSNIMLDTCNQLKTHKEDTESESMEEPDNKETTHCQPQLSTSTGLLLLPIPLLWAVK